MVHAPVPLDAVCPVAWKALVSPTFDGFDEDAMQRMKALFLRDLRVLPSRIAGLLNGDCRDLEMALHNLKSTTGYLRDRMLSQLCTDVLKTLRAHPGRPVSSDDGLLKGLARICEECAHVTRALTAPDACLKSDERTRAA